MQLGVNLTVTDWMETSAAANEMLKPAAANEFFRVPFPEGVRSMRLSEKKNIRKPSRKTFGRSGDHFGPIRKVKDFGSSKHRQEMERVSDLVNRVMEDNI